MVPYSIALKLDSIFERIDNAMTDMRTANRLQK